MMQRVRIGVIGTGTTVEWGILPTLRGPDALAAPDTGSWWSRRPSAGGDIRYQPPARPEVVALCAGHSVAQIAAGSPAERGDSERVSGEREMGRTRALATLFGVPAVYDEPVRLLSEVPLDAVFLAEDAALSPLELLRLCARLPVISGLARPRWIWFEGAPVRAEPVMSGDLSAALNAFAREAAGGGPALWMAAPGRRAAAHRAARRLVERDAIGPVTALSARWPFALDPARFGASFAAVDTVLSFVPLSTPPLDVTACRHEDGATALLLRFAGGVSASLLFHAADAWNSPWPRLEICGTQGRSLCCEGGHRVTHFVPREAARSWQPPGTALHLSGANLNGLAEDIKAFLGVCIENAAPLNVERALNEAARVLGVLEAAFTALREGTTVAVLTRGAKAVDASPDANRASSTATTQDGGQTEAPVRNLTLDLG